MRAALAACALALLAPAVAPARPASGPREDIDQRFTTTRPHTPTGSLYSASFHAAGNPRGNPPYLRKMVFYPPRGQRYDTRVPARCTASDPVLQVAGPDACPPGSVIGGGEVRGIFYYPIAHSFTLDHYRHDATIVNGPNQQIVLVKAEGYAVARGYFRPDGSLEFNPQTCFPAAPVGKCADDYILQLKTVSNIRRYTKAVNGHVRSYTWTPPRCPARGYWATTVKFSWGNGAVDRVVTRQPCHS